MKVCVIPDDKVISVNGESLNFDFTVDSNIHAIQWNGVTGHVEFKDGTPNEELSDLSDYQYLVDAYDAENIRMKTEDAPIVGFFELRGVRDGLLKDCDYTMLVDYQGDDQAEWRAYRQALRDITIGYVPTSMPVYPTAPS